LNLHIGYIYIVLEEYHLVTYRLHVDNLVRGLHEIEQVKVGFIVRLGVDVLGFINEFDFLE
jgi:hypothetical protein